MINEEKISIRKYADSLNIDEKAVRKARDAGLLGDGWDDIEKKVIPSKADAAWGFKHKVIKKKAGVSRVKANEKRLKSKNGIKKNIEKSIEKSVLPKPKKTFTKVDNKSELDSVNEEKTVIDGLDNDEEIDTEEKLEKIKITPQTTAADAVKYQEIFEAALLRLKLLEQQNILVKNADVDKQLFGLANMLKKSILNLPKRVVEEVRAAGNTVEATNIMLKEINGILDGFNREMEKQLGI